MTLVVAIASPTGIVMAADSQATAGGTKSGRASKLTPIQFKNGCALIGEAGNATLSRRAIQSMVADSAKTTVPDGRSIPQIAQRAISAARIELRRQNFECGPEELQRIIQAAGGFRWLVASFFDQRPGIFEIGMTLGLDYEIKEQYAAIGSGAMLAKYLLSRVVWPEMNIIEAEMAAVYVVEEVKKHDLYCGGNTQAAFVNLEMVMFDSPERLRALTTFAAEADLSIKRSSLRVIQREFQQSFTAFQDAMKELYRYVKKHPELENRTVGEVARQIDAERAAKRKTNALRKKARRKN